jgi:geranylgeranyl pyrophosphate synthase
MDLGIAFQLMDDTLDYIATKRSSEKASAMIWKRAKSLCR